LSYITKSEPFLKWLSSISIESTIGNVNGQKYANFPFAIPSDRELKVIADFLDKKTALIDSLVEKKKRQIELLKEQRQAVINQAVTKGLNPNVEMKDSGIEWLGKIPKHWRVKRLKYLVSLVNDKSESNDNYDYRIALENIEGFTGRIIGTCETLENGGNIFQKGDVLFNKLRPYLCKVFVAPRDGLATGELLVLRCNNLSINQFVFFRLLSNCFIDVINGSTYGTKMPRANGEFIGNLEIPFPNIDEQATIVEYLKKHFAESDDAISKAEKQIELLQEYRTALISEAVTGKIDVREAV